MGTIHLFKWCCFAKYDTKSVNCTENNTNTVNCTENNTNIVNCAEMC